MEAAWQPMGYTSPNLAVYPWMWLWDSCFHALVWAELDDERALTELESIFTFQTPDGFVPHMGYQRDPDAAIEFWGRSGASRISQPPMYAHAARVLAERGYALGDRLIEQIGRGLEFFWRFRMDSAGLVRTVHPWESGADDSPRWDAWAGVPFDASRFEAIKQDMVRQLQVNEFGSAVDSPLFSVASAMFNGIVAFNAAELGRLTGDRRWTERAETLATAIDRQWDATARSWVDAGNHESAAVRTSDAYLPVLVLPERAGAVWAELTDPAGFDAPFGPRNVDRRYPGYRSLTYWRGGTWPQINYLLAVGLASVPEARARIARHTVAGAWASDFSEYWDPDTGRGGGARPQSWTTLALVMSSWVGES